MKATKIFSFLWFSLFSGLFVFIWESSRWWIIVLFRLRIISFFFFILVGIDFINSTWIYFPIPAGHDTVLSKRKLLNILKINAEFTFLFNESSSHYSTYGAVSLANSPHFYFCYYFSSTTLQLRNVLFIKRFYKLEKLGKCYGTVNQNFFSFGVMKIFRHYFLFRRGILLKIVVWCPYISTVCHDIITKTRAHFAQ